MHGEQFFFDDRINPDHVFQPEFQPQIRAWLTDSETTLTQREAFLQALLDFDDDCGGFYRYRSHLLAAEYLALCPECRQGDAIVDALLKLSYAYFRVEKADWGTPPEAIVRSARETLAKTDLGRVVRRLEQLVRTTESRGVMGYAARELLRIQPGNRCGIAAIAFNELKPKMLRCVYGQYRLIEPNPLWQNAWEILIGQPINSDELAQVISAILLNRTDLEQNQILLPQLIENDAEHPLVLAVLRGLMQWDDSCMYGTWEKYMEVRENLSHLWNLAIEAHPAHLLDLMAQINQMPDDDDDISQWRAFRILDLFSRDNIDIALTFASLLKHSAFSFVDRDYAKTRIINSLGDAGVKHSEVIEALADCLNGSIDPKTKYDAAVSILKLDETHPLSIAYLLDILTSFVESEFTCFMGYELDHPRLWSAYYSKLLLFKATREHAIEVLEQVFLGHPYCSNAANLLSEVEGYETFVCETLLDRIGLDIPSSETTEFDHTLYLLRKIGPGNSRGIAVLEKIIELRLEPFMIASAASVLLEIDADNPSVMRGVAKIQVAIKSQSYALDDSYLENRVFGIVKDVILNNLRTSMPPQDLWQYLQTPDLHPIGSFVKELYQENYGDAQILWIVLGKLVGIANRPVIDTYQIWRPARMCRPIIDWLDIFSNNDLAQIVSSLRDKLDCQYDPLYPTYHAIAWKCAQQLPYSTFRQAWKRENSE
jgi:hypothetical protein